MTGPLLAAHPHHLAADAVAEAPGAHLYVHIPYCAAKCPYCDFNSIAGRDDEHEAYLQALLAEIAWLPPGPYATIFIGGGTPTMLSADALARLCGAITEQIELCPDYEWTCEANPGSADAERFAALAAGGVNRLSIGVQAIQEPQLRFLGRQHDLRQAEAALAIARQQVPRVSADCIIGLPGQSDAQLQATIDWLLAAELEHVSVYHLAIEPGTEFHARQRRGEQLAGSAERGRELLEQAWSRLEAAGLEAYETSNFARAGACCRHNLAYWTQKDYYAVGAGAVSTLATRRQTRTRHPAAYIRALRGEEALIWHEEELNPRTRLIECWMLGLRLRRGVRCCDLQRHGDDPARWRPIATRLQVEGLLESDADGLRLSPAGRAVQDAVTVEFLPD